MRVLSAAPRAALLLPVAAALHALAIDACAQGAPGRAPAPPPPDIFLATLTSRGGSLTVGTPANITKQPGYDNQPAFLPTGRAILFTSVRAEQGEQADIYQFDLATRQTTRVTTTSPESEYSATPMPGGGAISVVRVERDSAQRLWRFPLDGGAPSVILERVKPVGYHAWADDHTLALFVLGRPNTLQIADTRTGKADTVLTSIGRSLHRIPGPAARVSFVHKVSDTEWWIKALDPATRAVTQLVRLPKGTEDYAWLPDGSVLAGSESTLLQWDGRSGSSWVPIADLAPAGIRGITRLAVSPRGDRIAIVAEGVAR